MKTWVRVFLAIAFPLGIAAGLAVAVSSAADVGAIPNEASAAAAVAAQDIPATSPRLTPIVAAARSVAPSVVSVTVLRTVRQSSRRSLMEEFFGRIPRQAERQVSGLGSNSPHVVHGKRAAHFHNQDRVLEPKFDCHTAHLSTSSDYPVPRIVCCAMQQGRTRFQADINVCTASYAKFNQSGITFHNGLA